MTDTDEKPPKTCSDTLMEAFEKAENMEDVLIIWTTKDSKQKLGFADNNLTIAEANLMATSFQWHLMRKCFE